MYFDELDLNDNVLDSLYDMHFDTCTPVQEKCIPEILNGKDVLGVAQTGTGKTAAYLLPILSKLDDGGYPEDAINCVIMVATMPAATTRSSRVFVWEPTWSSPHQAVSSPTSIWATWISAR